MLGSAALYLVFRLNDGPDHLLDFSREWLGEDILYDKLAWSRKFLSSYLIGICVALHFIGAAALAPHLKRLPGLLERPIRFAAGLTFSLYLLHYPLLQFFAALTPAAGMEEHRAAFVASGVLSVVCVIGTMIERQKGPLKDLLLTWFEGRRQPVLRLR
jgi:membrane-bound acyltransferase YfiQ involved in biofilm formation